jgi:hypothetical protein
VIKIDAQTGNIRFGDIEIKTTMNPKQLEAYSGVALKWEGYEDKGYGIYGRAYFLPVISIDNFKWQAYIYFSGSRLVAVYFYCGNLIHHYGDNPKAASIWWKIHARWVEHATDSLERQLGIGEVSLEFPASIVEDGKQYLTERELKLFCDSLTYKFNWGEVYRFYHFKSKNPDHIAAPYDLLTTFWVQYSEMHQYGNWDGLLRNIAEREQCAIDWGDEEAQTKLAAVYKIMNHLKNLVDYDIAQPTHINPSLIQFRIYGHRYISISLDMVGKAIQYEMKLHGRTPPRYANSPDEIIGLMQTAVEGRI